MKGKHSDFLYNSGQENCYQRAGDFANNASSKSGVFP